MQAARAFWDGGLAAADENVRTVMVVDTSNVFGRTTGQGVAQARNRRGRDLARRIRLIGASGTYRVVLVAAAAERNNWLRRQLLGGGVANEDIVSTEAAVFNDRGTTAAAVAIWQEDRMILVAMQAVVGCGRDLVLVTGDSNTDANRRFRGQRLLCGATYGNSFVHGAQIAARVVGRAVQVWGFAGCMSQKFQRASDNGGGFAVSML